MARRDRVAIVVPSPGRHGPVLGEDGVASGRVNARAPWRRTSRVRFSRPGRGAEEIERIAMQFEAFCGSKSRLHAQGHRCSDWKRIVDS